MISKIHRQFVQLYNQDPLIACSPGRVNLIGEHTDYNEGFVLPGAIDKKIYVALSKNDENKINLFACKFNETFSFTPEQIAPVKGWPTYLLGVLYFLRKDYGISGGLNVLIDGDVPPGAGTSSSAALCSAFGFGLNALFGLHLTRMCLALIGQKTEHLFAGVQCGIMDQFASLHGKKGQLMKLDCRSLEYEYIPFDFPDYRIVLMNTMVHHSLAASAYNERRQQCEEGVWVLKQFFPEIHSLRDVSLAQLDEKKDHLPALVFKRCRFIILENLRLLRACEFLLQDDLSSFGKQMFLSHEGLSREYEVSCAESDFMVQLSRNRPEVAGARQMGGGFGGCTINIVRTAAVDSFIGFMQENYAARFHILPEAYVTKIEDGAKIINDLHASE